MKIYAKQVPPEHQASPFDIADYENIILTGNRHFQEHWPEWAENIGDALTAALDAWHDLQRGAGYYDNWEDILETLLPPRERAAYTREERKQWLPILERFNERSSREENNAICSALSLMTGNPWDWCELKGTCQGDWVECFYMEDFWTRDHLEVLEAEYFNTGTEWHITEGEGDPGYYQYCTGWNYDMIRREIAETAGTSPENIALFSFAGWDRSIKYEEVGA